MYALQHSRRVLHLLCCINSCLTGVKCCSAGCLCQINLDWIRKSRSVKLKLKVDDILSVKLSGWWTGSLAWTELYSLCSVRRASWQTLLSECWWLLKSVGFVRIVECRWVILNDAIGHGWVLIFTWYEACSSQVLVLKTSLGHIFKVLDLAQES